MAYPTAPSESIPTIATDATYDAPGEDWDGSNTKTPPSAGVQAQGYTPADPRPADFDNYFFSVIFAWLTYLAAYCTELLAQKVQGAASSTSNALARFSGTTGKVVKDSAILCADSGALTYGTAITKTLLVGFDDGNPTFGTWTRGEAGALSCSSDVGTFVQPISKLLPQGAKVTDIDILMTPGTTRGTSGNRTQYETVEQTRNFNVAGLGTRTSQVITPDDGTNALQVVPAYNAGAYVINKSGTLAASAILFLVLKSGNNASSATDSFHSMLITYEDPGPSAR